MKIKKLLGFDAICLLIFLGFFVSYGINALGNFWKGYDYGWTAMVIFGIQILISGIYGLILLYREKLLSLKGLYIVFFVLQIVFGIFFIWSDGFKLSLVFVVQMLFIKGLYGI